MFADRSHESRKFDNRLRTVISSSDEGLHLFLFTFFHKLLRRNFILHQNVLAMNLPGVTYQLQVNPIFPISFIRICTLTQFNIEHHIAVFNKDIFFHPAI